MAVPSTPSPSLPTLLSPHSRLSIYPLVPYLAVVALAGPMGTATVVAAAAAAVFGGSGAFFAIPEGGVEGQEGSQ